MYLQPSGAGQSPRSPPTQLTLPGNLTPSLPEGTPLKAVRTWAVEDGDLVLRFTLTNISGAPDSFADTMMFDPYTGDYGPNFFGHAVNADTFLTHDDAMG
jgi:hypothetical protein